MSVHQTNHCTQPTVHGVYEFTSVYYQSSRREISRELWGWLVLRQSLPTGVMLLSRPSRGSIHLHIMIWYCSQFPWMNPPFPCLRQKSLKWITASLSHNQCPFRRWLKNSRGQHFHIPNINYNGTVLTSPFEKTSFFQPILCFYIHEWKFIQLEWFKKGIKSILLASSPWKTNWALSNMAFRAAPVKPYCWKQFTTGHGIWTKPPAHMSSSLTFRKYLIRCRTKGCYFN